jgi:hypothetical protein
MLAPAEQPPRVWPDANVYSPQPVNFWQGATYQVVSGANVGATGTITSSTAANGSTTGVNYTLSPAISTGCASNDVMILRCRTAFGTCAGGLIPSPRCQVTALCTFTSRGGCCNF